MERVGLLAHLSSRLVSLSASGQSPMQQLRFRLNKRTSSPLSCQICVKHVNKRIKLSFFIPHPLMHCLSELGTCELIMGSNYSQPVFSPDEHAPTPSDKSKTRTVYIQFPPLPSPRQPNCSCSPWRDGCME